jgi:hypothetical protein
VSVESVTICCIRVKTSTCKHETVFTCMEKRSFTGKDHHHHHHHHITCMVLGLVTCFQSHYESTGPLRGRPCLRFPHGWYFTMKCSSLSVSAHSPNMLYRLISVLLNFLYNWVNFNSCKISSVVFVILPCVGKKVKQSLYCPGEALSFPGSWGSQISRHSEQEDGKVAVLYTGLL